MKKLKIVKLQIVFIFFAWILIKRIIVSSTPFYCWGRQIFEEMLTGEKVTFLCLWCDDKSLETSFEWEGAWVKMPRFNAFSRSGNTINLKTFPAHCEIYEFERKFSKHSGERSSPEEFIKIWKCILETNLEEQG